MTQVGSGRETSLKPPTCQERVPGVQRRPQCLDQTSLLSRLVGLPASKVRVSQLADAPWHRAPANHR